MSEAVPVGVFGAGAWGTALALVAARAGHDVRLAGRDRAAMAAAASRRRLACLPEAELPANVSPTVGAASLADCAVVLLAVPAQETHLVMPELTGALQPGTLLVSCAKGIDRRTGLLVSEIIASDWQRGPIAVLSGPGFAIDVSRGLPTAVTIAADDVAVAEAACRVLAAPGFRPYASGDLAGVQLGGALKNVLAIAAGVVAGRALGASAEAAVITRGFVEMRRLAAAWGAKADTLMGLSGLGDLILTCRSTQSRNFSFGIALGEGRDPAAFGKLVEGAATAGIAVERARAFGLDVPIMEAVAEVIAGRWSVDAVIDRLLARPLKREDVL